eukprot:2946020-Amphidinium_carterae.1
MPLCEQWMADPSIRCLHDVSIRALGMEVWLMSPSRISSTPLTIVKSITIPESVLTCTLSRHSGVHDATSSYRLNHPDGQARGFKQLSALQGLFFAL